MPWWYNMLIPYTAGLQMCKWIHMGCPCCYVREVPEQEARDICHRCKASNFQNAQARAGQSVTAIMGVTRGVKRIWRGTQEVSHTQTCHHCGAWFLKHSTVHIFSWIICVGCPIHCETFSTISGLYPLDAISTPSPSCDNQKCLSILPNVPWGPSHPLIRTTSIEILYILLLSLIQCPLITLYFTPYQMQL